MGNGKRILTALVLLSARLAAAAPTLPGQGEERLYDGELGPTAAWDWKGEPIEIVTDFGAEREVGGVRLWSGRSWISKSVKKAAFYADGEKIGDFEFRPSHTFKDEFALWPRRKCRRMKMTVEVPWNVIGGYYMWYMRIATPHMQRLFDSPPYTVNDWNKARLEIAELEYFAEPPADLPLPNADAHTAYPDTRLVRDWLYQECEVSNISHCASVSEDTLTPDPLGEDLGALLKRKGMTLEDLKRLTSDDPRFKARWAARREFLRGFRRLADEFLYVKHLVIGNSIIHATDDMTDASFLEWQSVPDYFTGSQLIRARIREDGTVSQEVLVDEPGGIIRDPSLALDASYVVFAKRSSMTNDNYHLWRYDFASRRLRQLTFEPTMPQRFVPGQTNDFPLVCADTEPCILPDGSILFQSTRVCHSVDCWPLPTTNLYRCDEDGGNIRRVGFDQIQTFYPQLLEDGRVAYTRWEYNDRNALSYQQPFSMNPDGTRQKGLFANNSDWPVSLLHLTAVPGTDRMLGIVCGHHAGQKGKLVEIDPGEGDDYDAHTFDPAKAIYGIDTNAVVYDDFPVGTLAVLPTPYDFPCGAAVTNLPGLYYLAGASHDNRPGRVGARQPRGYHLHTFDMSSQFGPQWAYPAALDGERFLVSYLPEGSRYYRGPYSSRFGIYAMDASGRRELLAFDWGNHAMQPVPIRKRLHLKGRTVKKLDYTQGFGTYYIQDVYHGAAAEGLERGSVKRLRVVAMEYRPVHIGWNWQIGCFSSQGKIGTPISLRNGAYDVKHVLGEAEVEADGSCMFRCPARTPVYFQLIDADGLCLQTMRSWTTLMPGEANSCTGCHEHPLEAAPLKETIASRKEPQLLKSAIPGRPRHPLLERLEREGPLASLENWMGVNRPLKTDPLKIAESGLPADEQGDGIGFVKDVQPIFDRLRRDYPGVDILGLDLSGEPAELPETDSKAMRAFSKAYFNFTEGGRCTDNVNFAHGLSFVSFRPPKTFGAIRSKWYWALAKGLPDADGKPQIELTDAERRTLAMWIDLAIPFCSSYVEAHRWDAWHQQRYLYTYDKRIFSYWLELDEIRRSLGMAPVPLTGFVPNVTEPAKQSRWDE